MAGWLLFVMLPLAVAERVVVVVRFLGARCLLFVAVAEALVLVLGLGLVVFSSGRDIVPRSKTRTSCWSSG